MPVNDELPRVGSLGDGICKREKGQCTEKKFHHEQYYKYSCHSLPMLIKKLPCRSAEGLLHRCVDLLQRKSCQGAGSSFELYMGPILQACPLSAGRKTYGGGCVGIYPEAILTIDQLVDRPFCLTVYDPETIERFSPLMPGQAGDG